MMEKPVRETEHQTIKENNAAIEDIVLKISVFANKLIL
jgi:hypothetical protein